MRSLPRTGVSDQFERNELAPDDVDDTPMVTCDRCDDEWDLGYELDTLRVGNRALERFALDHKRHAGHFPDEVQPWSVACEQCDDGDEFLTERPARRWAETHARHTGHAVSFGHADGHSTTIRPEDKE
mgnify:CR=1 FL=1|jgi:hypothetical protein